jgi:hypothetical protein
MTQDRITPEELREIVGVARKLRRAAEQPENAHIASLFRRTAFALEERADALAFHPFHQPANDDDAWLHRPVDITC